MKILLLTSSFPNKKNQISGLFVKDQVELAQSSFEKVQAESKALMEEAKAYNEEVIKLIQEGNAVVTEEVKSTVKKAAKKAA